jgi:uncharacterized protein
MKRSEVLYRVPAVEEHIIQASLIEQKFKMRVLRPICRSDNSERFPVLYITDGDEFFDGLANIARVLQLMGETPRFILVGIGYEDAIAAELLRMRDLFTHATRENFRTVIEQLAASPLRTGLDDLRGITKTTDSNEFLCFIREELMPYIEARYPVLPCDNSFSGYSAGGTFGLFTLFTKPDTFKRYIIGSPATSYDGQHFGIELAKAVIDAHQPLDAMVFMSVGELEEFYGKFDLTSGYYLMAKLLRNAKIPGLDLRLRVFLGETHATAWGPAFTHGVKMLFGPAGRVPWWPDFVGR